ncbi:MULTISPECIES: NAD-dependent epimerase/dehydratase family protein [unclassified Actinobaculum]|uniref:NAD-dependent epimerase/dehydratase family protein n=1 Tax=unclassified Actinobaculum TaxID=2609299 RepID=UPI000D52793B|nr:MULTISPECIES: NAD-dependent epimerase/dehydratase family protein [unclassified Actinobaculum]AWE41956.1 hypothetical protein DDD63_03385 [Actinobaculum sp. 313]RTE50129.1 NAD-dependent epimerase/dehydratase family protein [Actinobaculum sp. 352]
MSLEGLHEEHPGGGVPEWTRPRGRVGVVGGTGFLGSRIAEALRGNGWEVEVFSLEKPLLLARGVIASEAHDIDLVVWAATRNTPAVAAQHPELVQQELDEVTVTLDALRAAAPQSRVVFLSSGGTVYGGGSTNHRECDALHPESAYGRLKVELEQVVLAACDRAVILRVANAYGPGQGAHNAQGVLGYWLHAISRGEPITVYGNPASARDYVFVDDITAAVVAVANNATDVTQHIYNVGSGTATSLADLLHIVRTATGAHFDVIYEQGRGFDLTSSKLDSTLIERELGWRAATQLPLGVRRMWEWINA